VLAELARQYAGKVKMGQLNIDDCPRVATQLDVRSIPTLLLFKDGKVSGQLVGAVAKPKIDELVKKCL
jgi:thioredoxin 1